MKPISNDQVSSRIIKNKDKHEDDELNVWPLPAVEKTIVESSEKTNAMGKRPTWRYEPPEELEVEELAPLTAEEIEAIRQAAHDEGFNQGKEEGFSAGYEEGKTAGHEEGLTLGQEEGKQAGLAEGKEAIDAQAAIWQSQIEQLHQPLANVDKNIEEQLLHLVAQLTEAITYHEAKTHPDILMSAISTGIKALPSSTSETQVILHPDDIKLVEQQFGSEYIQEKGWRLLPSPQVTQGSCQIENSTSNIDLTLKTRIKEVLDEFLNNALHQ